MTYYMGPELSDWQRQIIMGTVLGGSSLIRPNGGRNSYLSMRGKEAYWIEYKSHELKDLASPNPFLIERDNNYFRWHSLCYPVFNEFYTMFYEGRKKVATMESLNQLRDIGLAVWFIDGGRLERGSVYLTTTSFGESGSETICRYFNEISVPSFVKKKGKGFKVGMTPGASQKFLQTIADKVPDFMHYRLVD